MCSLFVALMVVGAFIKIPVPVVPFTLQLLFTMMAPPPHRTCGTQTGGRVGGKGKVCAAAKAKQHAEQDNNEL